LIVKFVSSVDGIKNFLILSASSMQFSYHCIFMRDNQTCPYDATSPHAKLIILRRLFPKFDTLLATTKLCQSRRHFSDVMWYLWGKSHQHFIDVTALSFAQPTIEADRM